MNSLDFLQAMSRVDPKIVQEAMDQMENNTKKKYSKRIMRTVLIAAVVAALLCGAVWAASFLIGVHPVAEDETISGSCGGQRVSYEDAQMFLTFDMQGECHAAQFRANWLPSDPSWETRDADGWTGYLTDNGHGENLPYMVNIYSGAALRGVRCTLNGTVEIVGQDDWNGFQRTQLHVDYSAVEPHAWATANYILLFQPEDNYLVYIAGTSDMAVLEQIAENLEVRTGDVDAFEPAYTDICYFDLGRG